MSKVHARSHEITNKPLRVRTTKTLWLPTWKTNYNAEKCSSHFEMKNRREQNFQGEETTCIWIKKILDEATRIVNVFLISWFLNYFFSFCSVSLLVKYDFILRYEAWVNAIRASSFIENFPQISAKSIAFQQNLLGKRNWPRKFPRNSFEIGRSFPLKIPRNLTFFPATYQKHCEGLYHSSVLVNLTTASNRADSSLFPSLESFR